MGFNPNDVSKDLVPSFKFERVGDGLCMVITDLQDDLELEDKDFQTKAVKGYNRFLAIRGEIVGCTGGDVDSNDNVTNVPTGEERSILCQYQFKALGSDTFTNKPSLLAKAVAKAIVAAGAGSLEVGGELTVKHHELGARNKENPAWNRPKFYEASYKPPAKSSTALTGAVKAPWES